MNNEKELISYVDQEGYIIEEYNDQGSFIDQEGYIIENPNDNDHYMQFGEETMTPTEFMGEAKQSEKEGRWKPTSEDMDKLENFLNEFGEYLADEDAELVYKKSRNAFGPKFEYKSGKGKEPSSATKKDIADYIDKVFFGD